MRRRWKEEGKERMKTRRREKIASKEEGKEKKKRMKRAVTKGGRLRRKGNEEVEEA